MEYIYGVFHFCEVENKETKELILTVPMEIKVNQFQLNMMLKNPIKGLVTVDYGSMNGAIQICYYKNGKKSLNEYFKTLKSLDDKEYLLKLLKTLYSVTRVMILTKNIYLDKANFAIDAELIYVEESNMNVNLLYVPIQKEISIHKMFERMIEKLFNLRTVNELGKSVLENLRKALQEDFEPEVFSLLIVNEIKKFNQVKPLNECNGITGCEVIGELKQNSNEQERVKDAVQKGKSTVEVEQDNILKSRANSGNRWRFRKLVISISGIQLLFAVVVVFAYEKYLKSLDDLVSTLAFVTVLGAIDIFMIRKIFEK